MMVLMGDLVVMLPLALLQAGLGKEERKEGRKEGGKGRRDEGKQEL